MKFTQLVVLLLFLPAACAAGGSPAVIPLPVPPAADTSLPAGASFAPQPVTSTTLYLSATMHIESSSNSWPNDAEAFLAYLEQTSAAGVHWSIGGDIGWLTGDPHAREIVTRAAALGVQWDVHAHKASDRGRIAATLASWGVTPTAVISGMLISEYNRIPASYTYNDYSWTPAIVWGGTKCAGHRPGCDSSAVGLYRPKSSLQYTVHSATGKLICVAGGNHQLATARSLADQIAAGQVTARVVGFTIMVSPTTLRVVESTDDIQSILAFVAEMNGVPFVRWATISETAQAWVQAGSVAVYLP
jgi:hypothetical protein